MREAYGLERVTDFSEITSDVQTQQQLASLYGSVDDIDPWVGGLAEDHVAGSSVGELFGVIIADQFHRLRDGDRFWYENDLDAETIAAVNQTSLSDIIARNSSVDSLQSNAFVVQPEIEGLVLASGQNQEGTPVEGAALSLLDGNGREIGEVLTDSLGRYRFGNLPAVGSYQIVLVDPNDESGYQTADIQIRQGDQIEEVDFVLGGVVIA